MTDDRPTIPSEIEITPARAAIMFSAATKQPLEVHPS